MLYPDAKMNLVDVIRGYRYKYPLNSLFDEIGVGAPQEIYIRVRTDFDYSHGFIDLALFYSDKGVLAIYRIPAVNTGRDKILNICPLAKPNDVDLIAWPPADGYSFSTVIEKYFFLNTSLHESELFTRVSDVIPGSDEEKFFETYKNPASAGICFTVPNPFMK